MLYCTYAKDYSIETHPIASTGGCTDRNQPVVYGCVQSVCSAGMGSRCSECDQVALSGVLPCPVGTANAEQQPDQYSARQSSGCHQERICPADSRTEGRHALFG